MSFEFLVNTNTRTKASKICVFFNTLLRALDSIEVF